MKKPGMLFLYFPIMLVLVIGIINELVKLYESSTEPYKPDGLYIHYSPVPHNLLVKDMQNGDKGRVTVYFTYSGWPCIPPYSVIDQDSDSVIHKYNDILHVSIGNKDSARGLTSRVDEKPLGGCSKIYIEAADGMRQVN